MKTNQLDWQRAAPQGEDPSAYLEAAAGPDDRSSPRESHDRDQVVVTTRAKWEAFAVGVKAGECDAFAR
ncbi:DUF397 domain-containing protein [Streptomyces sp. NPDC057702]|uniref:DUF397 domain-containing protein n=1 Tax=unclassified Streptomyces TaxID=2593676 RepID=UPI0036AE47C2